MELRDNVGNQHHPVSHLTFIIRKADRITAADKSVWIVRAVIATGQGEDKLFVCDTEPAK